MRSLRSLSLPLLMMALLFTACNRADVSPNEHLTGDWTVTKVEGRQITNGVPGIVLADNAPNGYIRFDTNGRGEQNYSFQLFGSLFRFNNTFYWSATYTKIVIDLFGSEDMVWFRNINEPNMQEAFYNIAISPALTIEYTLTLSKD